MPITVVCGSCKARFTVSDKFAGKEGPCPKCKTKITIPKVQDQVTIHAPEEQVVAGKTVAGGPTSVKPIPRKQTRLQPIPTIIAACAAIAVLAITAVTGKMLRDLVAVRVVGLFIVSIPLAAAGYSLLREEELEPHRGRWLWVRAGICAAVFVAMWSVYYFIPVDLRSTAWSWFFIAPTFLAIGAGVAYACFDLEYSNGLMLYAFYLGATLALGAIAHLEMPWTAVTSR